MKRILIIYLLTMCYIETEAQSDSTFLKIRLLNLSSYEGKPVDSLLAAIPPGYTYTLSGATSSNKIRYLGLYYPDMTNIRIWVRDFNFMNAIVPNRQWNLSLFKKELLWYVCVYNYKHNGRCSYDVQAIEL